MHDWRHHYKVFPSVVLKWRRVLRIRIVFYVTGQKITKVQKSLAEALNRFEKPGEER